MFLFVSFSMSNISIVTNIVTILGYRLLLLLHDCELQVAMKCVCVCVNSCTADEPTTL